MELVLSFLISLVGVLLTSGEFLPIRSSETLYSRYERIDAWLVTRVLVSNSRHSPLLRSLASVISSPDFHVFNHRGKALHSRISS